SLYPLCKSADGPRKRPDIVRPFLHPGFLFAGSAFRFDFELLPSIRLGIVGHDADGFDLPREGNLDAFEIVGRVELAVTIVRRLKQEGSCLDPHFADAFKLVNCPAAGDVTDLIAP